VRIMNVALIIAVNEADMANAARTLERHERRLYPDTRPGGVARCQACGGEWPCTPVQVAMHVQAVSRAAEPDRFPGAAPVRVAPQPGDGAAAQSGGTSSETQG
jgi:hypothetical protein